MRGACLAEQQLFVKIALVAQHDICRFTQFSCQGFESHIPAGSSLLLLNQLWIRKRGQPTEYRLFLVSSKKSVFCGLTPYALCRKKYLKNPVILSENESKSKINS